MNKELITARFKKAKDTYSEHAVVQQQIAKRLASLFNTKDFPHRHILEIGCGSGFLTQELLNRLSPETLTLNDLTHLGECLAKHHKGLTKVSFMQGDAETLDFKHQYDLICSSSTFQWFRDPEAFFSKAAHQLCDNGYLLFSTFLPGNMLEIKTLTGVGLAYPDLSQLREWISGHFQIEKEEEDCNVLYFDDPHAVLLHLKKTGVTGVTSQKWTPGKLRTFIKEYQNLFSEQNQVRLTYKPVYILARKKALVNTHKL